MLTGSSAHWQALKEERSRWISCRENRRRSGTGDRVIVQRGDRGIGKPNPNLTTEARRDGEKQFSRPSWWNHLCAPLRFSAVERGSAFIRVNPRWGRFR